MQSIPNLSDAALEEIGDRGLAIYETLKPLLEPRENNRFVAIHVDTKDYETARFPGAAVRALLVRHAPDGHIVVRRVGADLEREPAAHFMSGGKRTAKPLK